MEAEEITRSIFGHGSVILENDQPAGAKSKAYGNRRLHSLTQAEEFVKAALGELDRIETQEDNRPGRIGPAKVRFDVSTHHGLLVVSPDRLSVNSQSNFCTMRANTALYGGKWMYEVQLGSKGIMQIGWGTARCQFSGESGVGDTATSYAYDGNRVRKWNVTTHKYGDPWLSGDVIGCALDMDDNAISFYRNGRALGVAFEEITSGPGTAYFPTVSLAFTENLTANFGSTPLKYPVRGFQPLQAPPTDQLNKATLILEWFGNLVPLVGRSREETKNRDANDSTNGDDGSMSAEAYLACLARMILKHLGPLLKVPYITEALFVPFVQKICANADERWKLAVCLDLLWMFLEEHEMKSCLLNCVVSLLSAFRHVSLMLAYPDQCDNLVPLINLCRHAVTRQHLLQHVLFDHVRFANFLHVKPLDERGLAEVVDRVWWETRPLDVAVETSRRSYMESCDEIKTAISELECLQIQLLILLLDNDDGTARAPSSRTIFLRKFRRFVQENLVSSRTPLPITVCCFHRLLGAFKILWSDVGDPMFIPCRSFYDSSVSYDGIDRLGGVLSHLNKTYKSDLINRLGADHEVITSMDQPQESPNTFTGGPAAISDLPTFARMIRMRQASGHAMLLERLGYPQYAREDRKPLPLGKADENSSLLELLDGIVLFYHAAAKKQIAKVAGLRESMTEYVNALSDAKTRLELIRRSKDPEAQSVQRELLRTIGVFNTKLAEQSRHMAWVRAAVYSEEKQTQIAWLLQVVTLTLRMASQEGNMFSFVPDFYLEALSDLCVGLRSHLHPTAPIENIPGCEKMLLEVAQFLCDHFLDPRIVHANAKDTLILTLAGFISNPLTLGALERVPKKSRVNFVTNLLRPYENRAWAQSNWVLVRFWQGNGFAFRYEKSPHLLKKVGPKMLQHLSITQPIKPYPSAIYQQHMKEVLLNNLQATTQFLNSLLNQLNWAFSEFIGMVQEIHNVSSRPERVFIESRQLKICATCFDLAVSLLRVLEMIAAIAPSIFNDPSHSSSENLLVRLCQLLCQILNRVSSQTSSFQHVVLLDIPDLETVDHFPILAAVIGLLLALLKDEMNDRDESEEVPRATRTLLSEPSFQMSSLYFVLGEGATKKPKMKNLKPFSLLNYKDDVSEQEIINVRDMINHLDASRALLPETRLTSDDDDTCTICYAYPVAVTFKPCNHQSCRGCIDRHVLNSRECFFCKTIITEVRDLEGLVLHDLTANPASPKATSTP